MNLRNKEYVLTAGRCTFHENTVYLGYSAAYLECKVKGTYCEAVMSSDGTFGEENLRAWVAVFVEDMEEPVKRIELQEGVHTYSLFAFKEEQEVVIRIMKYSEAAFATAGICDLVTDGAFLPHQRAPRKLIEFIGDSITCGYGIEAAHELIPFSTREENPWIAYACKTARNLDMDFELVSWSGNGIITHYIDPDVNEIRHEKPLMPEMYPYTDRELDERLGIPLENWAPDRKPDIVVVNLGTNDTSYTRRMPDRNALFMKEFRKFMEMVREKNPQAILVAVCGIMDDRLNDEIRQVILELKQDGDQKIFVHQEQMQLDEDGRGADYHPSKITHEKVAKALSAFIQQCMQS